MRDNAIPGNITVALYCPDAETIFMSYYNALPSVIAHESAHAIFHLNKRPEDFNLRRDEESFCQTLTNTVEQIHTAISIVEFHLLHGRLL